MRIENSSPFRAESIRKIVDRLGNKLRRKTPFALDVRLCCKPKGRSRCGHGDFPLTNWPQRSRKVAFLWLPRSGDFSVRDLAYALDVMMQGEETRGPANLSEKVAIDRHYRWADAFPLVPKREREKKPPPVKTAGDLLSNKLESVRARLAGWEAKEKAAATALKRSKTAIRSLKAEERALGKKLEKAREGNPS